MDCARPSSRKNMTSQITETLPAELGQFNDVIDGMGKLLLQAKIYPRGHPSVDKYLDSAFDSLTKMLSNKYSVVLRVFNDSICYLNYEFNSKEQSRKEFSFLINSLDMMSVGELEIEKGIGKNEFLSFMEIAASVLKGDREFDLSGAWNSIEHIKVRHDMSGSNKNALITVDQVKTSPISSNAARKNHDRGEDGICGAIGDVLRKLEKIQSNDGMKAGKLILDIVGNENRNNSIALLLKSLTNYDDYTFRHSVNVAVISAATARHVGFGESETAWVGLAALMHDIGKLYVPKKILKKSGRLSPAEWQMIRKHPVDGAEILKAEGIDDRICKVAYQHHMRHDLTGYPAHRGEKILQASEIVRIADTYDALTTKRVYRKQISPYEAIKMMARTRKTEFHPQYFDNFLHMMGNIPIGSILVLESGETVIVVDINRKTGAFPRVRVIRDSNGVEVDNEIILDLNERNPGTRRVKYRIRGVIDDPVRNVEIGKYLIASDVD